MTIVELGCGKEKREFTDIGIDIRNFDNVDIVHNLERGIPLPDNCCNTVLAYSILEHIQNLPYLMQEIHRILKNRGYLHGKVPHYKDKNAFHDPTHTRFFTEKTFNYWDSTTEYGQFDYFHQEFRVIKSKRVKRLRFWKSRPIKFKLQVLK